MDHRINNESIRKSAGVKWSARYMAVTAMLSVVAFVLQYVEFPIPLLMPSFIKMDLSDLPALIGAFAMGPMCGVLVCLVKNLLHLMVSQSAFVGEFCNFLLGVFFVLPAGWIYTRRKLKQSAVIGGVIGMISMAALSFPLNLFIVYPMYANFMPMDAIIAAYKAILPAVEELWQCLLIFNVPFTFIKALLSVIITMLIYKKISPLLHGR